MKNMFLNGVACASIIIASSNLSAASIVNGFGLSSPATTITFSEVALTTETVVTNQFNAFGVEFSGAWYTSVNGDPGAGLRNFTSGVDSPTFTINFSTPVTEVAWDMITNGYTDTFTALLGGSVVESFSATTGAWSYYGFKDIVFDEIRIDVAGGEASLPGNPHMRLDNLQLGTSAVPVPAAAWLLGSGLLGLVGIAKRKKV